MQTTFHRMKPSQMSMIVEPDEHDHQVSRLLCVECGWEGEAHLPAAPWVIFMNHPCRLMHTMTSGGD